MKSPAELSRAIARLICRLPKVEMEKLKHLYDRSWLMVILHMDGMMIPTKAGGHVLLNFFNAVIAEGRRLNIPSFGEDTLPTVEDEG